jgi:hypothetical protein
VPSESSEPLSEPGVRRFRFAILLGLLVFLGFGLWVFVKFLPVSFHGTDWILSENGNQIFRADQMQAGKALYREIDCQYGPLPIWIWYGFTILAGNTISANILFQSLLSIAFVGCLFWWLTRGEMRRGALVAIAIALLLVSFSRTPYLHLLITIVGNMEYYVFERFLLLAVMVTWRPIEARGRKHAPWLVLILLAWQSSKVGGAFMALAAYGAMDVLWLITKSRQAGLMRDWFRWWCAVTGGLVLAELVRCGLFVIFCGWEQGMRSAWPFYVTGEYERTSLTLFASFRHFVAVVLPILVPVFLFLGFVVRMFRRPMPASTPEATDLILYQSGVGVLFYLLSAVPGVGYFGHEWHFFQYQWVLLPFTLVMVFSVLFRGRAVLGLVMILGVHAGAFKVALTEVRTAPPAEQIERLETRIGPVMAPVGNELLRLIRTALELVEQRKDGQTAAPTARARSMIIGTWGGSGWYVAADERHRPHNTFFSHAIIRRPSDNEEFGRLLRETQVLIIAVRPISKGAVPAIDWLENVVGPEAWQQIKGDFVLHMKGAGGGQTAWELHLRKPVPSEGQ